MGAKAEDRTTYLTDKCQALTRLLCALCLHVQRTQGNGPLLAIDGLRLWLEHHQRIDTSDTAHATCCDGRGLFS